MKALAVLVRREILDRRMLLLAGFVSGLLALATPLIPGAAHLDIQLVTAGAVSLLFLAAGSLLVGGSVFTRDLAERRFGFWLARPVGETTIWAGKLLGGFLAVLGTGLAAVAPAVLVNQPRLRFGDTGVAVSILLLVAGVLLAFLLVNTASLVARSHSRWAALDGIGLFGSALLLWLVSRPLEDWLGRSAFPVVLLAATPVFLAALLFASWRQVSAGRADTTSAHRASSLGLWGVVLPTFAGSIGLVTWLANPPADALRRLSVTPAGATGRCVNVTGYARGRFGLPAGFLVDTRNGRTLRIPATAWSWNPSASRDGRWVAWLKSDRESGDEPPTATLFTVDLDAAVLTAVETKIAVPGARAFALSPAGDRVAFVTRNIVSVVEIATGREIAAARLDGLESPRLWDWHVDASFQDANVVRIHAFRTAPVEPTTFRIFRFDSGTKRLEKTGERTGPLRSFRLAPDASSLVLEERGPRGGRLTLCDGWTGAERRTLVSEEDVDKEASVRTAFLPDGRPLVAIARSTGTTVRTFTPAGDVEREAKLGGARVVRLVATLASGEAILSTSDRAGNNAGSWTWKTVLVDTATGAARALPEGLTPPTFWVNPSSASAAAASPERAFTFVDGATGALVRLDPATFARTTLLPGGK